MNITDNIRYIGVDDYEIDLFESMYPVPEGVSYNSYVILDEKTAVMDTVEERFYEQWIANLEAALGNRKPDYLIVQHMEPDHSANVLRFAGKYPETVIVSSQKAFSMMKNFFGTDFENRRIMVAEGDRLSLGKHKFIFLAAPMVHWPEVIMTYEETEKILFSADAFGKFGALCKKEEGCSENEGTVVGERQRNAEWDNEARRYYFGIVGKYGVQVQNLLKKVSKYEVKTICSLHGPVLNENLEHYLSLYQTWASYRPEKEGIVIAYASIYGNTAKAVRILEEKLRQKGYHSIAVYDLARCDMTKALADAFRYNKLVLASPTYNAGLFPVVNQFISYLTERNYSNRKVAFVENGTWAPMVTSLMKKRFEQSKGIVFAEAGLTLLSAVKNEDEAQLEAMAEELCACDGSKFQDEMA